MKIAIKGHPFRGKEIIQILENLNGKNVKGLTGTYESFYYIDNENKITDDHKKNFPSNYKLYTLEEFEKEFPFKIGDRVIDYEGDVATIMGFDYIEEKLCYSLQYKNGTGKATSSLLKPYKEMKEERNVVLTLDKAREWFAKGGELKEIALQAFTEKELNPLPRSWNEFCRKYKFACLSTRYSNFPLKYDALFKLEQLRDCWRQGWEPTPEESYYVIKPGFRGLNVYRFCTVEFLSFPTREMAEDFLECFRDLIEQAGDLI